MPTRPGIEAAGECWGWISCGRSDRAHRRRHRAATPSSCLVHSTPAPSVKRGRFLRHRDPDDAQHQESCYHQLAAGRVCRFRHSSQRSPRRSQEASIVVRHLRDAQSGRPAGAASAPSGCTRSALVLAAAWAGCGGSERWDWLGSTMEWPMRPMPGPMNDQSETSESNPHLCDNPPGRLLASQDGPAQPPMSCSCCEQCSNARIESSRKPCWIHGGAEQSWRPVHARPSASHPAGPHGGAGGGASCTLQPPRGAGGAGQGTRAATSGWERPGLLEIRYRLQLTCRPTRMDENGSSNARDGSGRGYWK